MSTSVSSLFNDFSALDEDEYVAILKLCMLILCSDGEVCSDEKNFIEHYCDSVPSRDTANKMGSEIQSYKIEVINIMASSDDLLEPYIIKNREILSLEATRLAEDLVSKAVMIDGYASASEMHLADKIIALLNS